MKKDPKDPKPGVEVDHYIYDWKLTDGFQGHSENQIKNNARVGGYTFVLFIIALVWFVACELIKWLS